MINIAFQGSTHGNFLRYMLDRHSSLTPAINKTPFTKTGTSHNLREEDYSNFFKRTHPHLWGWDPANQPHIVVTIEPEDVLLLQRIVYIRAGDKDQDLRSNNIIIDASFNDAESIEKLYGIKINKVLPRFILRDFCKLGFSDIQNHGLMTIDKTYREKKLDNAHYFPVASFWDQIKFFEQIKIIGEKFKLDLKLDDSSVALHQEFIDLLPQLKTRYRARDIITAIKENKDIDIQEVDLIEEAYIYSWIETTHKNILAPFTNRFFANTKEIIDYIHWYPHFYHGMNPTLPTNSG